jgi:hypothetical protein
VQWGIVGNAGPQLGSGGEVMKKLSIIKLEKRIAPRYVPF